MGKRRTRITIETQEIVVARCLVNPLMAWCANCGADSGMMTLAQAALFRHLDRSVIQEWIDSGQLHVLERQETGLLICTTSLGRHH